MGIFQYTTTWTSERGISIKCGRATDRLHGSSSWCPNPDIMADASDKKHTK